VVNKTDLVSEKQLAQLEAILRSLNASAKIIRSVRGRVPLAEILDTGRFDFDSASAAPGWMAVARGEELPESVEYGITSFVYRARQPFHPDRLYRFIANKSLTGGLLRSKGFVWIVTRPMWTVLWSQAGHVMEFSPQGVWWADAPEDEWPEDPTERAEILANFEGEFGDRRQELVFIGKNLNEPAIRAALDAALMTAAEMSGGPEIWSKIHDPFPEWPTLSHLQDEPVDETED
jgi:G3E family GTPase